MRFVLAMLLVGCVTNTAPTQTDTNPPETEQFNNPDGGCPGNQYLAIVPDATLEAWRGGSGSQLVRFADHFWDVLDVRIRTFDQMTTDEYACWESAGSKTLPLRGITDRNLVEWVGLYSGDAITFKLVFWDYNSTDVILDTIAHELGHAIGLQHVLDETAVMYVTAHPALHISFSDVEEYYRVWQ